MRSFSAVLFMAFLGVFASRATPQGNTDYLNFETPQVKPLSIAHVGGLDYLLACNTPDSSVEIYRIDSSALMFVGRAAVGMEPVSVLWVETIFGGSLYTCNMLGDSITRVDLSPSSSSLGLEIDFITTAFVGDEPSHAVLVPGSPDTLWVALNSQNRIAVLDLDLTPLDNFLARQSLDSSTRVLGEVRCLVSHNGDVYALDHQGEKTADAFDLARFVGRNAPASTTVDKPLGTTHFNMTVGRGLDDGDLYIVGQVAQFEPIGEEAVSEVPFGFVHSTLFRVGRDGVEQRNLNATDLVANPPDGVRVAPELAISMPTDVAIYDDGSGIPTLFVPSFGTDRLLRISNLIDPSTQARIDADLWDLTVIDIPRALGSSNPLAGPRGVAIHDPAGQENDRVFVLNRLDNSIVAVNPNSMAVLYTETLENDPTPAYIREGQPFLYNAKLSPTSFVSCASCHIDGRLDGLRWDLGLDSGVPGIRIPRELIDGDFESTEFRPDKGAIVTQSLQGLVNWEAPLDRESGETTQLEFTNAPYHWRGDREDFLAFRGAFESLLGFDPSDPSVRSNPVSVADMRAFELFVNSIHYPPNPDQSLNREYGGVLGDPHSVTDGSGALLGLKAVHIVGAVGGRSCVHCHSLPEGSNNLIPQMSVGNPAPLSPGNGPSTDAGTVVETATWRGVKRKQFYIRELGLRFSVAPGTIRTDRVGLLKSGVSLDIDSFLQFFDQDLDPGGAPYRVTESVHDFLNQFDSGIAPMVGFSSTSTSQSGTARPPWVQAMEWQAHDANVGLAVQARMGGLARGFYFDQSGPLTGYREELLLGPGGTLYDFGGAGGLLSLLTQPSDRLTIVATPLGSERRFAHINGQPTTLATLSNPRIAAFAELAPNSANSSIPQLEKNVDPNHPDIDFRLVTDPLPVHAMEVLNLQIALGITPRHEPPRRLRVAGDDIELGATMTIRIGGSNGRTLTLPIYPTNESLPNGQRVWSTAVEAAPEKYYTWMTTGGNRHDLWVENVDGRRSQVVRVSLTFSP